MVSFIAGFMTFALCRLLSRLVRSRDVDHVRNWDTVERRYMLTKASAGWVD